MSELLIRNIAQLATPIGKTALHGSAMRDIKIYNNATVYIKDGIIAEIGSDAVLAGKYLNNTMVQVIDASGKCAVPGFVDAHTHFVFGGVRPEEFIDRLAGVPYLELLKRGGGICATMQATRQASSEKLYEAGKRVLTDMLRMGVTTVEGKSGYGLDKDTELKQLEVMKQLNEALPTDVVTTFLGAHAVPPEYTGRADKYIDFIIDEVLPVVQRKQLAEFCDVFCETGVFTNQQSERLLKKAVGRGFKIKMHADEMNSTGGAGLSCKLGAVSADHLLSISRDDISKMAESDVIAVLLPVTAFCMRKNFAPGRALIDAGGAVALGSDFNPGSCYSYSVPLVLGMAVIGMQLHIEEALTAMTLNAAAALDRADVTGSLEVGKQADIVLLNKPDYRYLVYHTGINIVDTVIKAGKVV